jgi:hypothetical protein
MNPPDLLVVSLSAFAAVFLLLSFLAVVMRVLIAMYPEKTEGLDAATVAAISAAAAYVFPGTKVTKVEEIR